MLTRAFGPALAALVLATLPAVSRATPAATPSLSLDLLGAATPSLASVDYMPAGIREPGTRLESARYYPRWHHPESSSSGGQVTGYFQFHGGFLSPTDDAATAPVFGVRVGSNMQDRVQLGLGMDWSHRSDHQSTVIGTTTLPGGGTAERRVDLSSASSDLLPVLAFFQISPGGARAGGPYVGIAGGYEAMFLSAKDFATNEDFNATYTGWGWQLYGGFAFPMSDNTRFNVEGFTNSGDLDREVHDPAAGQTYREVVSAGAAGVRLGVSWGF